MTGRSTQRAGERGVASLEMVAFVPLILLIATFALQVGAAMWTASSTTEAVREAARAYSLGDDPIAAAAGSLPGSLRVAWIGFPGPEHTVQLTVDVPRVSLLPQFTVTRRAVMP